MKIFAVNRNSFLSGDKGKSDSEFEQKVFKFFKNRIFQILFAESIF